MKINEEILKKIDINKNHIENFSLETEEGTKKYKEKFTKNAIKEKNNYINNEINNFNKYKEELINYLVKEATNLIPEKNSQKYNSLKLAKDKLNNFLIDSNKYIPVNYKYGFSTILENIDENISLIELNKNIIKFIDLFNNINISLTEKDFNYTMFTNKYMKVLLENMKENEPSFSSIMKKTFDNIYWECPTLIYQLKLNLNFILIKYNKKLKLILEEKIKKTEKEFEINKKTAFNKYTEIRKEYAISKVQDEYNNLMIFFNNKKNINDYLNNSEIRNKNYNTFCIENYNELTKEQKQKYKLTIIELFETLVVLKKYYKYENILLELIKKYKQKDKLKVDYLTNSKNLEKELKLKEKINKNYNKSLGLNIFTKYNPQKLKLNQVLMNDKIEDLRKLYNNQEELEIAINIDKYINDSSTIYDFFMVSTTTFPYLIKSLKETTDEFNLDNELEEYFRFLYNPSNNFLRKISAFSDFKINNIISDKFKLLGLKINDFDIDKEHIDITLDTISFINQIENINESKITIEDINFICKVNSISKINIEEKTEII